MYVEIRDFLRRKANQTVPEEIRTALEQLPNEFNEYGYDSWGFNPKICQYLMSLAAILYRNYFRVQVEGIENVPEGRVILVANHSGQIPIDALLLWVAMAVEGKPPRIARGMVERWFPKLPWISWIVPRMGHVLGHPKNCINLLDNEEAIMVFPEGVKGSGKVWKDRYKLMDFGQGFLRLALETNTPIVPIGIIGGEEQVVSLWDGKPIAKLLGMPYLPFTPTFPWLGPLGITPLPTKYRIYFDEPLRFEGDHQAPDHEILPMIEVVRSKMKRLIAYGLEKRTGIFW